MKQASVSSTNNKPASFKTRFNQRLAFWLILLCIIIIFALFYTTKQFFTNTAETSSNAILVTATPVRKADIPIYFSALGTVTPLSTITIHSQINGILIRVLFQEGQIVKAGDLLAEIDPRLYQAELVEYQGQLIRDKALLANAIIDLKRYQTLWKQNSISQQTLATQQSLVQQYIGAIQVDQGLIETAKVNLSYCYILAPVTGRIGLRFVDAGNYVQNSDTNGLAIINTESPITVIFTLSEDKIPAIKEAMATTPAEQSLAVQALNRQQTVSLASGKLLTIDNQIDTTTGTVKLKAIFENTDHQLFANQFVNIKLLVKTLKQAMYIPTSAIQYSGTNTFVYVVNEEHKAVVKSVLIGSNWGENTVIASGLSMQDQVITDGIDNLTDGALVKLDSKLSLHQSR